MSNKVHSIRAKVVSKLSNSNDDKARMKHACSAAVSALEATIRIVKGAAGHTGPPGLQTRINGLLFVIGVIKKLFHNAEDVEHLGWRVESLTTVILKSKDRGKLSEAMIDRINTLST